MKKILLLILFLTVASNVYCVPKYLTEGRDNNKKNVIEKEIKVDWTLKYLQQEIGSHLEKDIYGTNTGTVYYKIGVSNSKENTPRVFVYGVFEDRFTFTDNKTFAIRLGTTYSPNKLDTYDGSIGIERDWFEPYDNRLSYVFDFRRTF